MLPVSRMMDMAVGICTCHKNPMPTIGWIYPSTTTVLVNSLPVARMGDIVITACGHMGYVMNGSTTVLTQSLPTARIGDIVSGCCFQGTIIQGSSNVLSS